MPGVYGALVKYGFCMGPCESGWADATPLLHAIRAVDSEAFVALLLSSVTFCLETEDIVEVSSLGPIKSKKRRVRRGSEDSLRSKSAAIKKLCSTQPLSGTVFV